MWAHIGDSESPHLQALLEYATSHYARHTDWFLRHRDIGISTLATILTAESAVGGLYLSDTIEPEVALSVISMLTLLSIPLALLPISACARSFRAALEHAALVAKIMWALGLVEHVPVNDALAHGKVPLEHDSSLYIPRYHADATESRTTREYVETHLRRRGTTYQNAKWTLRIMGMLSVLLGAGTLIAIVSRLLAG